RTTKRVIAIWSKASAASLGRTRSRRWSPTPASSAPRPNRCWAGSSPFTAVGKFDASHRAHRLLPEPLRLTTGVTHLWRLLKWGRTLARHGALTGIEEDPLTPPQVRRLARI